MTTPKFLKSQKGILFYLQLNEPVAFKRTPPKCQDFLKKATLIREYKSLAEPWVIKAYVHFCFNDKDISEDDIDYCNLAELTVLRGIVVFFYEAHIGNEIAIGNDVGR